jgi:hypothetical protein
VRNNLARLLVALWNYPQPVWSDCAAALVSYAKVCCFQAAYTLHHLAGQGAVRLASPGSACSVNCATNRSAARAGAVKKNFRKEDL